MQVDLCQDRGLELEKEVQNPRHADGKRVNILGGKAPDLVVLQEKIEALEGQLAEKERELLGLFHISFLHFSLFSAPQFAVSFHY